MEFILDIIDAVLYWLERYSVLLTIAIPANKNPLLKLFNE
tara:strand:+ start:2395 stop:2514 length:120 start_codon:yes stop_codon:yes gene_type:complete